MADIINKLVIVKDLPCQTKDCFAQNLILIPLQATLEYPPHLGY